MISESISKHSELKLVFIIEGITIGEDFGALKPSLPFVVIQSTTIEKRRVARWRVRSIHLPPASYSPTLELPLNGRHIPRSP